MLRQKKKKKGWKKNVLKKKYRKLKKYGKIKNIPLPKNQEEKYDQKKIIKNHKSKTSISTTGRNIHSRVSDFIIYGTKPKRQQKVNYLNILHEKSTNQSLTQSINQSTNKKARFVHGLRFWQYVDT